jgi:hypothetical protein
MLPHWTLFNASHIRSFGSFAIVDEASITVKIAAIIHAKRVMLTSRAPRVRLLRAACRAAHERDGQVLGKRIFTGLNKLVAASVKPIEPKCNAIVIAGDGFPVDDARP